MFIKNTILNSHTRVLNEIKIQHGKDDFAKVDI